MTQHYWFGKWVEDHALETELDQLDAQLAQTLQGAFPFAGLLDAAEALSRDLVVGHPLFEQLCELACKTTPRDDAVNMIGGMAQALTREAMLLKLRSELSISHPGILERRYPYREYEAWYPAGCVVHVTPANVFAVAALGLVESLLVGNVNIVKLSARDSAFAGVFADALAERDPSGRLKDYMAVVHVASAQTTRLHALFNQADVISAWGGEKAIAAIKQAAPQGTRVVAWGHKVSFGYLAQDVLGTADYAAAIEGFARDVCRLDQQACSSPQTLFVEADKAGLEKIAQDLAQALQAVSPTIPGQLPDSSEQAEITSVVAVAQAEQALGLTQVIQDEQQGRWRILIDYRDGLRPSPLYRTIWLKPIQRDQITRLIRPMRAWLQSCGLACGIQSLAAISRALLSAGVTRIARPGHMVDSYLGSPHDGVYALQQLARRVTVDAPESLQNIGSINQLEPQVFSETEVVHQHALPVVNKQEFMRRADQVTKTDLVFRSGGSSGKTIYSKYTWDDYNDQMRAAAHGLVAAGIEPLQDRAMNLFAAGHLYGSFISFWSILEVLKIPQWPMAMSHDYEEIAQVIEEFDVNVLIGAPSHILALFNAQAGRLKGHVKKVFYGGEKMTAAQVNFLQQACGVELVRSASYGSNDIGPMGYQCPHCEGSQHHVLGQVQRLEILDMDKDEPVKKGESGRLIFTSSARNSPNVKRYEIGDTGRWVETPCPCGRADPKFELTGRMGDFFKAGGPFFNYRTFVDIADQQLNYTGPLQVHITEQGHTTLLRVCMLANPALASDKVESLFREHYPTINYMQEIGLAFEFEVVLQPIEAFEVVAASGKVRPVCDHR